jgi:hypothetical protein
MTHNDVVFDWEAVEVEEADPTNNNNENVSHNDEDVEVWYDPLGGPAEGKGSGNDEAMHEVDDQDVEGYGQGAGNGKGKAKDTKGVIKGKGKSIGKAKGKAKGQCKDVPAHWVCKGGGKSKGKAKGQAK